MLLYDDLNNLDFRTHWEKLNRDFVRDRNRYDMNCWWHCSFLFAALAFTVGAGDVYPGIHQINQSQTSLSLKSQLETFH